MFFERMCYLFLCVFAAEQKTTETKEKRMKTKVYSHDLGCFCALELVWAPALASLARSGSLVLPHDMAMLFFVLRRDAFALLRCLQGVVCIATVWARAG